MAQKIKQGNIFGRIGTSIGKSLADQIPKEVDRYRLAQGLEDLSKQPQGQTPFQQFSSLAAIPGITPQMLQSGSELLRQQGIRSAYQNEASAPRQKDQSTKGLSKPISEMNFAGRSNQPQEQMTRVPAPSDPLGQQQIVPNNPLRDEVQPRQPWTQQQRDEDIGRVFSQHPNITRPEAVQISADNEKRELAQPEAARARDEYLKGVQAEADDLFSKQLETKLQKAGKDVFGSITGEDIEKFKRGIERDLATNPKASMKDVVNDWSTRALNLGKAKSELLAKKERNQLLEGTKLLDSFRGYQKIFKATGSEEEFYNILKSDFGLSPQGAASIAYPRSKGVASFVSSVKPLSIKDIGDVPGVSRGYASKIENLITANDSIQAIMRDIRMKDPYFDQAAFLSQLRNDMDNLPLTDRQRREIGEGVSDFLPNWADIFILPSTKGVQ